MKTILFSGLTFLLLSGCNGEAGPAGPALEGNISGHIILVDSTGIRLNNYSGVTVSIEGTSYTATSNTQGAWTLANIRTGIYTINCSKQGYDIIKIPGFQFTGGGTAYADQGYLYQLPTFIIEGISISASTADREITITGVISSLMFQSVIVFISKSGSVSSNPAHYMLYNFGSTMNMGSNQINTFSSFLRSDYLSLYGISRGEKIYVKAYPITNGGYNSYTDPATGNQVFTGLGPGVSNVDSIVVP